MRCVLPAHRDLPENPWEWVRKKNPKISTALAVVINVFIGILPSLYLWHVTSPPKVVASTSQIFISLLSLGFSGAYIFILCLSLSFEDSTIEEPAFALFAYPAAYALAMATGWASKTRIDLNQYRRETAELLQAQTEIYRLEMADFDRRLNAGRHKIKQSQDMMINLKCYIKPLIEKGDN